MILSIDPGLSKSPGGTGWALVNEATLSPEKTGIIRSCKDTWQNRAMNICEQLQSLLLSLLSDDCLSISLGLVELPTFFQSKKGMMCATGKEGDDSDLVKLAYLVGKISHVFYMFDIKCQTIGVNEWKGTGMSKYTVAYRIASRLGLDVGGSKTTPDLLKNGKVLISSHAIDAVGIALHYKGVFKANTVQYPSILFPPPGNVRRVMRRIKGYHGGNK